MCVLDLFPFQVRGIHCVSPNECALRKVIPVIKGAMGRKMRQRLVLHQGTDEEIQASMAQFGLNWNGTKHSSNENFKSWVHWRLAKEYADSYAAQRQQDSSTTRAEAKERSNLAQPSVPPAAASHEGEQHIDCLAYSKIGLRGDERMKLALQAKIRNPKMSAYDALKIGGFAFPKQEKGMKAADIYDCDNISLQQRKNQLSRRICRIRDAVGAMDESTERPRSRAGEKKMP